MPTLGLMFVAGVWILQQMAALPNLIWLVPLFIGIALLIKLRGHLPAWLSCMGALTLAAVAGFMWAALAAHIRLADVLPAAWEGRDIELIGVVADLPQTHERGQRFLFDVEQVLTAGATVSRHISLTHYSAQFPAIGQHNAVKQTEAQPIFHAGERWRLTVRLKRPHGTLNPHGFDFEAWALERNMRAMGYVRKNPDNRRLASFVPRPVYAVEALRESIRKRMATVLADREYAGILQALAIGDDEAIDQAHWDTFLRTGINHLISISGLHITMLSGLMFGLVYQIWRRSQRLTLQLPARKAATLAGLVTALLYALVAGFSVPTQRTLYMLAVFAAALWFGRNIVFSRVLAWALLLVVLLDPWAVLAPGFWLSFGAVAVIAYAAGGRLRQPHWLRTAINTQWAVSLGLIPLLLVLFQQVSLIGPIANALAIPLVSFVVVPLTLLGAMLPLDSLLHLAHWIVSGGMQGLQWLAGLPLSTWQQQAPPMWTLLVALIGVTWMLLPRGFPLRWLGLAGLLPMLLLRPVDPLPGTMQVAVLDVGQGLAVVIRTATHALLYDAGPRHSAQSDSGSRVVIPYLRAEGVTRLDGMIISHDDSDHSGGMQSILAQMPVAWLASSLPSANPALTPVRHVPCYAGQSWVWDEIRFEMLAPTLASYGQSAVRDNNRSCVLRVVSRFGSLLLPGDIEKQAEKIMLGSDVSLDADILVAPHHGSKTSSTAGFVAAVKPAAVIFTVGYRNRFGHPKQAVMQRYQHAGSAIYRSDDDGAVLLNFSERGIETKRWRIKARRYWHPARQEAATLAEKTATR
jgi:competence protein ComEC